MQKKLFFISLSFCLLLINLFNNNSLKAQNDSTPAITFSGYAEVYYSYDFSEPIDQRKPGFFYSYNRHNETNLNLGFLKGSYSTDNVRATLAVMTGTYANANLAAEPGVLKNIYEANVGARLSKKNNLWVDAGIFGSHIGFESAIGKDNATLTRSLAADNTPYYESGAKITYITKNNKWIFVGLVLNGWQRIQRVEGNNTPAFGHQITYKPNDKILLNSSSFAGSDKPDSVRQMRYLHDFYGTFTLSDKLSFTAHFDIGFEEKPKDDQGEREDGYNVWYNPTLVIRYIPTKKTGISLRGEYYNDENGVIIATGTPNGFKTFGYSINFDYALNKNALWRIEARDLNSEDKIFTMNGEPSNQNISITTALTLSF